MDNLSFNYQSALTDFHEARQRAWLQEIVARLRGKSTQLLSYEEVAQKLRLGGRAERGVQTISIEAIVGSVCRYTDFTRTFLPRRGNDQQRWAGVKAALVDDSGPGLPPIDVYKVGEVYFVLDGNHRVSIARQEGLTHIDAHVIEVQSPVPLTPDVQPDDLIIKAEYAAFLTDTRLKELRPQADLSVTAPGQYEKLKEHLAVHRYIECEDQRCEVSQQAAVEDWYDNVYVPIVTAIRERGALRWFPNRTETDLYLWVSDHRSTLEQELGWAVSPEAAVTDLTVRENARASSEETAPGSWRRARLVDRYIERLFKDILVPLNGTEESWVALDQALDIAGREGGSGYGAQIHGLHLVSNDAAKLQPEAQAVRAQFEARCAAVGMTGNLVMETGDIARKIIERALLTDLVVLNVAHPPGSGLTSLGHGLRNIIWRCARPILAVPGRVTQFARAVLAYDGSPKSKEALFVAAYLAEIYRTQLTVFSVNDGDRVPANVQDYARAYLEMHEIEADFIISDGPIGVLNDVVRDRSIDLVLMGGYGVSALEEVVVGSAVNMLLREAKCPLLICR